MASSQIQNPINAVEGSVKSDAAPIVAADGGGNNSSSKNNGVVTALKDRSVSDAVSCISSADAASSYKESEVETEALMPEQSMYYPAYGYYYPGFDGSCGGWDAQSYYAGSDGLEIQSSASQGDSGSVLYYFPGYQPDYAAYSPFMPGSMVNVDGQYLGQQLYYPSPIFSQPLVSPGLFPQPVAYSPDMVPAYSWDSSPFFPGYADPMTQVLKTNFSSQSHMHAPVKTTIQLKSVSSKKGSSPAVVSSPNDATHSQTFKPINKAFPMVSKGFIPTNKVSSYPNQGKSGLLYPHRKAGNKETGRSWVGVEKLKARNLVHETGGFDMLNEQSHGPRTNGVKNTWNADADSIGTPAVDEENDLTVTSTQVVSKDVYNHPDFSTKYAHAFFFVIKSFSEDDIHKSIKYNVWASTPSGNKRLEIAFQLAQERMDEKGIKHPVFLFFSVNASGQFCGVAEMIGQVDFTKNMDFWQQDKWTGYFPVKWHIIKDVPNPQFRHIILENNENKPVTNSRDTQEVRFLHGMEMLNIFKNYASKTSILDDFNFYENRQRVMADKKIKHATILQPLLPKADGKNLEAKPGDLKSVVSGLQFLELAAVDSKEQLPVGDAVE